MRDIRGQRTASLRLSPSVRKFAELVEQEILRRRVEIKGFETEVFKAGGSPDGEKMDFLLDELEVAWWDWGDTPPGSKESLEQAVNVAGFLILICEAEGLLDKSR